MIILFVLLGIVYVIGAFLIWALGQPGALGTNPNAKPEMARSIVRAVLWPLWVVGTIVRMKP